MVAPVIKHPSEQNARADYDTGILLASAEQVRYDIDISRNDEMFRGAPLTAHPSSKIACKSRLVPVESGELFGSVYSSTTSRMTEIDAELLSRWGMPIPASDTIRELRDKGYKRCGRCGFYKEPDAYSKYKRAGYEAEYLHTYCKGCRAEMKRTHRWSTVIPMELYPARVG